MGEHIEVLDVQAENGATIIQVDIKSSKGRDRLFIETKDIFKALNNYIYTAYDRELEKMGFEKMDPNAENPNLIK